MELSCKNSLILALSIVLFWYMFYLNLHFITENTKTSKQQHHSSSSFGHLVMIFMFAFFETFFILTFFIIICRYIMIFIEKMKIKWENYQKEKFFSNEVELSDQMDCCICLDNMEKGIQLKCHHFIHKSCLYGMIEHKLTRCPLCCHDLV